MPRVGRGGGRGEGVARLLLGGGGRLGGVEGVVVGGAEASAGPHARLVGVGVGLPPCAFNSGWGSPATCVHASAGWRDWAATPAHFSTGGGGGGRRPTAAYPCPVTNRGVMDVLWNRRPGGRVGVLVLCAPQHAGLGVARGGGGGRATVASAVGPPGVRTRGSGRGEHDLHPAVPPPRLHEFADREPVGITHGGTIRCLLRGDSPLAPPRDPLAAAAAVVASIPRVYTVWYAVMPAPEAPRPPPQHRYPRPGGDAHARASMGPGALRLVVSPLDQEHPALGSASRGLRGGGTSAADGRGPRPQRGASRGATWESCAPSLQWRRGDRQSVAAWPYRQPRASWSAGPDTARPWGTRCTVDSPHLGSAPVSVHWRKHPMRMSSRLRRRGTGPLRAWSAQATAAKDPSVRGWRGGGGGAARGSHG